MTLKSLVRFLVGFILVYQLPAYVSCKSVKISRNEIENSESKMNHEQFNDESNQLLSSTLNKLKVDLIEASINHTNTTLTSLNEADSEPSTHISRKMQINGRSLSRLLTSFNVARRSFRRIFFAWNFYGPEIGLSSCLFQYAWQKYPIVSEMTYSMMGRARQMLSGFMQEFRNGFIEGQSYDDYRISSKVAETTADDYYDYHRNQAYMQYGPFKRVGNHATNLPENVKIVNKSDPKLIDALEMLKNLQPKRNTSELVNRLARHLKLLKLKSNNDQQFRFVNDDGDEVKYFPKYNQRHDDADKINNKNSTVSNSTVENNKNITKASDGVVVEARSSPKMKISQTAQPKIGYAYGPPAGLPTYNQLPPPDYSYYKDGVYHHVHDLREEKHVPSASSHHSSSNGGGGWLGFDFEDTILSALGLEPPGRSSEPSVSKCSKGYIFGIFIRYLQTALVGG